MLKTGIPFYSGTSGLALPVPKANYPADFRGRSRLAYFAHLFNSLEVNSSFYKLPQVSTVQKWANEVDDDFQFTFKMSKNVSHAKQLAFMEDDVKQFMQVIENVQEKTRCILIQFPPSLKSDRLPQLKKLLALIPVFDKKRKWKIAVEFRNTSWYNSDTYTLLQQYEAALVLHDLPVSATPLAVLTANFTYLRFHGPGGRYRGSYSTEFLYAHAKQIRHWINEGKTVYAYFNNTMGDAAKNLAQLNEMVCGE